LGVIRLVRGKVAPSTARLDRHCCLRASLVQRHPCCVGLVDALEWESGSACAPPPQSMSTGCGRVTTKSGLGEGFVEFQAVQLCGQPNHIATSSAGMVYGLYTQLTTLSADPHTHTHPFSLELQTSPVFMRVVHKASTSALICSIPRLVLVTLY